MEKTFPVSATLAGGGNIGSHAATQLARVPGLARVTVVDRDRYGPENLSTQDIEPADVGRPKAEVQAGRIARIRPDLEVEAIVARVEDLPLARLRANVILGAVDNNRARQALNEAALRLGVPWIDAGVEASGLLARVNVWAPGAGGACLECSWSDEDYLRLEQAMPCTGASEAPATNAPSSLGALAASFQVLEARKILEEGFGDPAFGHQILVDARFHGHYFTRVPHRADCRIADHAPWPVEPLPGDARTIADLDARALQVWGRRFARELHCRRCARSFPALRLTPLDLVCERCAGPLLTVQELDELESWSLDPAALATPLGAIGLRRGDVLRAEGNGERLRTRAFEITEMPS